MASGESPAPPPGERHGAGTYQMLWDCRFCGTERLLGITHRHCPNCGAAQDPAWRYFPAEGDMIAVEDHPYVGADKICPACQQPNSAASQYCSECGADLATGQVVQTQGEREIGTGAAETDTRRDVVQDQFNAEMARIQTAEPSRPVFLGLHKQHLWIIVGLILVGLVIAGIVYAVSYRSTATGEVARMTWERSVAIENFQPRAGAGWREGLPGDAYSLSCTERQRGTRKVAVGSHEECRDVDQGDGTFRRVCQTVTDYRDEPVYDDWCSYRVDRWSFARQVTSQGEGKSPPPAWPVYQLAQGIGRFGQERAAGQDETYAVTIREADGDLHTCRFRRQQEWEQYSVGAEVTLELTLTGSPDCDSLRLAR